MNNRVEMNGPIANALVQIAAQLIASGVPVAGLRTYSVRYGPSGDSYVVEVRSPALCRSRYVVSASGAHAENNAPLTHPQSLPGATFSALYQAEVVWKTTQVGREFALATTGVTIAHPFLNAPNIYWVYFAPPDRPYKPHTLGCDIGRGFSVDVATGRITAFKRIC